MATHGSGVFVKNLFFGPLGASLLILSLGTHSSWGAIEPIRVSSFKNKNYQKDGAFIGGTSEAKVTLIQVKRRLSKNGNKERLLLRFGDERGRPLKESPLGYYHIQIQNELDRIIMDFSQTTPFRLDQNSLSKILKDSRFFSQATLSPFPEDHSTHITLSLKEDVKASVFAPKNKGYLIVDLIRSEESH